MINVKESQIQEQDRQLQRAEMKHDEVVCERNEQRRRMQKDLDDREDTITDLQRQLDVKNEFSINQDEVDDKSKRFEDRIWSQEDEINSLLKQVQEVKISNKTLKEDNHVERKEIDKLKLAGGGKCNKCEHVKAEKEELSQEKESLEEEVEELQQEMTRLESLLDVYQQDIKGDSLKTSLTNDTKPSRTKRTPIKEEIITPIKNRPVENAKASPRISSMTSSPSSRHSSRSGSPAIQPSSTVNPMKLAAAMKRLSLKPGDAKKATASPSPRIKIQSATPSRNSEREQSVLSEITPTASASSSRKSSISSLERADRQRAPEPETKEKSLRQSVRDMPKEAYQEESRTSLNTLEARLKSLQSSSKARKAALEQSRDPSPGSDARRKQTRFVLPSSKKFDRANKPKSDDINQV